MPLLSDYLGLIAREHQAAPNFLAFCTIFAQGHVDNQAILQALAGQFDFDVAVGAQLDAVGVRIGQKRYVANLPPLNDDDYRVLLRGVIAAHHWDGTLAGAAEVWTLAFTPLGYTFVMIDRQDSSIDVLIYGPALTGILSALIHGGSLDLKPAGIRLNGYFNPSVPGTPVFGLDVENQYISGLDVGSWAVSV